MASKLKIARGYPGHKKQKEIYKMKPTIVTKEAFKVIGLELRTSFKDGRNKTEIPPFFHKVLEKGRLDDVPNRVNQDQLCIFKFEKDSPDFSYIMGVEVESDREIPEGMVSVDMPASQYATATFIKRGFEDVSRAFGFVDQEWLPKSDYVRGNSPGFVYYDDRFFSIFNEQGYEGNPVADVYFPVQAK
jgi:AraC family transcriptional regulator